MASRDTVVDIVEVDSGYVMQMRDETFGDLLDEINAKSQQIRFSALFGLLAIIAGI